MHYPVSGIIPSALPVRSRLTSSFTCQLMSSSPFSWSITCLLFHSRLKPTPFQQILPTLILLLSLDCHHDHETEPDLSCLSIYFLVRFSLIFLFVPCGRLLMHVKYTVSYRILTAVRYPAPQNSHYAWPFRWLPTMITINA